MADLGLHYLSLRNNATSAVKWLIYALDPVVTLNIPARIHRDKHKQHVTLPLTYQQRCSNQLTRKENQPQCFSGIERPSVVRGRLHGRPPAATDHVS